ncbi:MAG: hypothetical protein EZS28_003282 [Streblomastix strix]|uniref:WH1 domain-containing protein n=1 Tax=Streblomastix strix TaxID=222440 RepID=A0A5J4X3X0_9EUKA|nr:MAG: hypothetical protein EZS28_003282 [Streblomastix strix]
MAETSYFSGNCQITQVEDEQWRSVEEGLCQLELLYDPTEKRSRFVAVHLETKKFLINAELLHDTPVQKLSPNFVHFQSPFAGSFGFNFVDQKDTTKLLDAVKRILQLIPQPQPDDVAQVAPGGGLIPDNDDLNTKLEKLKIEILKEVREMIRQARDDTISRVDLVLQRMAGQPQPQLSYPPARK